MYKYVIYLSLITIILLPDDIVRAQTPRPLFRNQYFSDTLGLGQQVYEDEMEVSDEFYDKIKERHYTNKLTKALANLLIRSRDASDYSAPSAELEVSRGYFEGFKGRTIADIRIVQANIFFRDSSDQLSWTENFLDNIHIRTKQRVVEKYLLFEIGDALNPYTMAVNEEMLRSMDYFSTAYFVILPQPGNPTAVTVNIFVRDNWSIGGDVSFGSTPHWELYDRNFIGSGNQLSLIYYPKKREQEPGIEAAYDFNNIFGTFADVNLRAGVGRTNNVAQIYAQKPFILPNDHMWGFRAGYEQHNNFLTTFDSAHVVNRLDYGGWYGFAWNMSERKGTSLYLAAGAEYTRFNKRPITREGLNPYYYNATTVLASIGLSRQNFYQGNMIYGYGRVEDIPYGFKFELVSGFQWNEYLHRRYYVGGKVVWGDLTPAGYYELGASAGTFITNNGELQQSALNASLRYFSPLFRLGSMHMRQFINIEGTWGFNRMQGEREALQYNSISRVRGMRSSVYATGYNRLTAGVETVFFSPVFFYHFRFAYFIWSDVGWLGYKSNIFSNQIASSIGLGVRIKNERLIFRNIQLRLGVTLRHADGVRYNPFQVSNEELLLKSDFAPGIPSIVSYD